MNAKLSIACIFALLAASVSALSYEVLTSYSDAACTQATGGFSVKATDICKAAYTTCTENFGVYLLSNCTDIDPIETVPDGYNVLITYPSSDGTCTLTTGTYTGADVAPTGVCFAGFLASSASKFSSCGAKANYTQWIDLASCQGDDSKFSTGVTSYTSGSCTKTAFFDMKSICASGTPVAAPANSAPQAGNNAPQAAQTPAKKSSSSSIAVGLSLMAFGLVVLA